MKSKLVFRVVVLLFFVFSSFPCFAQSSNNDQRIVGTWIGTATEGKVTYTITLVFNANGSGTLTFTGGEETMVLTFIYGFSLEGSIKISVKDSRGESFSLDEQWIIGNGPIYFSPDGKSLFFDTDFDIVYRKR